MSPTRPAPRPPSIHLRALLTWLAVYTAIMAAQLLAGPHIGGLPLAVRTLVLSAIVVPLVVYVLLPALLRVRARLIPARDDGMPPGADRAQGARTK